MRVYQDRMIEGAGSCPLAIREYGGSGTPVLLLHGATRTLADWEPIARDLLPHHRVVAMELRNHGRSGDGPWTWEAVLHDLRLAMAATGLERPAIVGHSLGGMIAALYSASGGECLCVVNLDGHTDGRVDQYIGIEPEAVRAFWRSIIEIMQAERPDAGAIGVEEMRAHRASVNTEAATYRIPDHIAANGLERSIKKVSDGEYLISPGSEAINALRAAVSEVDWWATFRGATSPLLIYNCIGSEPVVEHSLKHSATTRLMAAAYRRGLQRDLAVLADEAPQVSIRTLDADHMFIVNMPQTVSTQIHQYIASVVEHNAI